RAYAGNPGYKDQSFRACSSNHEVMGADRKAMVRALDRLEQLDFDSEDENDTKSIYNAVTSYLDVYNNAVSSAMESDSSDIRRTGKNMKALMKEYGSSLEEIGIQVKSDGTVKIDKSELKKATTRQVSKVFGNEDYLSGMGRLMKKLRNQVNRESPKQEAVQETVKSTNLPSESVGKNLNLLV
ncbi:MAG: hypothetical protein SPG09_13185, partial [Lachnospiraceae bacterium]|nr:hypothetical protein [bacterium]MDY5518542.1 hypothetical protein [Lachnospiraceae bacterium]